MLIFISFLYMFLSKLQCIISNYIFNTCIVIDISSIHIEVAGNILYVANISMLDNLCESMSIQ